MTWKMVLERIKSMGEEDNPFHLNLMDAPKDEEFEMTNRKQDPAGLAAELLNGESSELELEDC